MDDGRSFLNDRVIVKVGDITKESVDAIVNAANGTLMGGGGVDGAIHRAGGPEILAACKEIRRERFPDGLPTGQAVITTAGKMPAKHVIHTVGPVYGRGGQDKAELLAACYSNSLSLVVQNWSSNRSLPGDLDRRLRLSDQRSGRRGVASDRAISARRQDTQGSPAGVFWQ